MGGLAVELMDAVIDRGGDVGFRRRGIAAIFLFGTADGGGGEADVFCGE